MKQSDSQLKWWHWCAIAVLILWIFFSLGAYYVTHKPFTPATIYLINWQLTNFNSLSFSGSALLRSTIDILIALWIVLVALGCGLWWWRGLKPKKYHLGDKTLFSFGLGFGTIGLLMLLMGLLGLLSQPFLFGFMILLTFISIPVIMPFSRELRMAQWKRPSLLITFYLTIAIGLAFTLSLIPPILWDSLSYHLKGPWLYLQAGRIYADIDLFPLNYPFLLEMVFMLGMGIRSDISAQLVHFFFTFLLAGMTSRIAVNGLKLKQGWTAVLLLFATPMILMLAPAPYNDLALAFVTLASLYAFSLWYETEDSRWLILSGIFSGLAMSLKYTSFLVPALIGLLLIWQYWRDPRRLLRLLITFTLPAFLVAIAWYIKNWVFMGNPIYPFVFNGRYWAEFRSFAHRDPGSGIGFDPIAILTTPYTLTLGINESGSDTPIGPLFLALFPLILLYGFSRLGRNAPYAFRLLLLYVVTNYAFWLLGAINSGPMWQSRFILPAFAALCPVLAWIIDDIKRFDHDQFSLQRFVNLVLAVALLFGLVTQFGQWLTKNPLALIVGNRTPEAYLEFSLGNLYQASAEMTETLPADAVIQFLWEPRTYYCELDCRSDLSLDKYTYLEYLHTNPDAIAQALTEEGVTHLFVYNTGLQFLIKDGAQWVIPDNPNAFQSFMDTHTIPVQQWDDTYSLYELVP